MMRDIRYIRGVAIFEMRLQYLLDDGYHISHRYEDEQLFLVKLRHHNGNRIILKLTFPDGILSQFTNHVKKYADKVC